MNAEEVGWRTEGETPFDASSTRSGGRDELHGQDAVGDVRVWFVERREMESRQGFDHDDMDRSSGEGR